MSGQLCNFSQLGNSLGMDGKTVGKYVAVLEHMFLLRRIETWSMNRLSRIVKTPKIHFIDSGLLSVLVGLNGRSAENDRSAFGHALESYVYAELLKQSTWTDHDYAIYTYRDRDLVEVDFVVEDESGHVLGVEVKAAASVSTGDLVGLKKLAKLAGKKWVAGVVLYDGVETLPIGEHLWAVPLCTLWSDWS
jgi:uncharacterized protein